MSQIAGWRNRLAQIHPDHSRIARSAVWVSLFALIGKSAGALKEMSIAYRYGISNVVDAYQLTLTLITWLPATFVAVLSVVLVPALVELRSRPKQEQAKFLGELDVMAIVVGVAFTVLLYFSWPYALDLMARNLSDETRVMSRRIMLGMAPVGIVMLTICVYAARLQAREKHVNTLLECVPALVLLCFVLAWHDAGSPAPLIWGSTLGFILQAVLLGVLAGRADQIRPRLSFSLSSPQWPHMYRAVGVFMIGQFVMSLATPLDQYFVAGLGDGNIATLGYASRVLGLLVSMGAVAISRATLPVLSELLSAGDNVRARSIALKWSLFMLAISGVVVVVAWLLAPFVVKLLFQRGAFSAADTVAVSSLFRWGLIQIPFYFSVLVLVQLFASQGRFKAMAAIAVVNFAVKAVANFFLIRWFGITGVVLATGVMGASSFVCYLSLTLSDGSLENKKAGPL
ncbi:murein biosynthesis integral membrane protein MurJ [Paraburkholderia phytofirmans]|uniref:Virulence factor MVIN family protein n=1 Tax=Paraburkholderia phytofirmans (strain DSM 17436 / LMG 22146 / PsJN) TaxID=398527 RepID=B2TDN2_PARPJ|nr:lipid II flippase MurJ [Paraburkholderia phytofirmans]ACD19072.1 virulence factor MVIN family protein [Paraburkholderia phytofirmans PsJN]